jgi:hypothetical protein
MADMPPTRASLLVRLRDPHNAEAWEQFVQLYAPLVYQFARRKGLQDADAADLGRKVAAGVVGQQLALERVRVSLARGKRRGSVDRPDVVILQAPEGVLGVVRLPGRPELLEQGGQLGVQLAEGQVALLASAPAAQGVQDQQRLVRGPLLAVPPDEEPVELLQDRVARHKAPTRGSL